MNEKERIKLINDVFAPKPNEKILFLIDKPHGDIKDNQKWKDRRELAYEWYIIFKKMGKEKKFYVEIKSFKATGVHNSQIPIDIKKLIKEYNIVIAMTEYSASSSLITITLEKNLNIRVASMPMIERRMEKTAFKADYKMVKKYADSIKKILNNSIGAEIRFSTQDYLYIDIRNRNAHSDTGECTKKGQFINFPSGEACIAPYEATKDEIIEFGKSKTKGILPVDYNGEIIKYEIENNKIFNIIGFGNKAKEMTAFFNEKKTHCNIAELGIGCNPKAVVTGNVLEDEKVAGLHIAYGMSTHLGGKIESDMHMDICYPKCAPIEAISLKLIDENFKKTELINKDGLCYDLL